MYEILPSKRVKLDDKHGTHIVISCPILEESGNTLHFKLMAVAYENDDDVEHMLDSSGNMVSSEFDFDAPLHLQQKYGRDAILASAIHIILGESTITDLELPVHVHNTANIRQRILAVRRERLIAGRKLMSSNGVQDHAEILNKFAGIIPTRNTK